MQWNKYKIVLNFGEVHNSASPLFDIKSIFKNYNVPHIGLSIKPLFKRFKDNEIIESVEE